MTNMEPDLATILVVDDTPDNLTLVNNLLKDHYHVRVAISGERALKIVFSDSPPDLILLDVMMPVMDGYEVCRRLRANESTRKIPIIFLTAKSEMEDQHKGLVLGASDYITKPISPPILNARINILLMAKRYSDKLLTRTLELENEVNLKAREFGGIQEIAIKALAALAETRDSDTSKHIQRTQHYVKVLAVYLKNSPRFRDYLTDTTIDILFRSAPLHDIGKVGIPDRILMKPGRLDATEFSIIKTHTTLGRDVIESAQKNLPLTVNFFTIAKEIAYTHHEKWDGSGYPEQLRGDAIPISGRLMAIADVYDALINHHVYKNSVTHEVAVSIIAQERGLHFDPEITDAFLAVQQQFQEIASTYQDDVNRDKT